MPDSCCCTLEGGKCTCGTQCANQCKAGKCNKSDSKCGDTPCKCPADCKGNDCKCSPGECKCTSGCKEKSCCK